MTERSGGMAIDSTDLLGKQDALVHMENGGQVFRISETKKRRDRFFYKIEEGKLMCRVNECGGWHPSVAPLRDTDELYVATVDWKTEGCGRDARVVTIPLPCPTTSTPPARVVMRLVRQGVGREL